MFVLSFFMVPFTPKQLKDNGVQVNKMHLEEADRVPCSQWAVN